MKPIKLIMEGFGPYLKETVIDFDRLNSGLTLITGNTGAGKTTIFDAICCALYGDTSGRSRSFSQMRNESAQSADKTRVEFTFELKGKTYKIERSPRYLRPKKSGEGNTVAEARAEMIFPDGRVVSKVGAVTSEVEELLGIKKDEFRQIVMIAQNDFMAMIKETNKEQEKTFNRIFDAKLYEDFDAKIREKERELSGKVKELESAIYATAQSVWVEDQDYTRLIEEQTDPENIVEVLTEQIKNLSKEEPLLKEELEKTKEEVQKKRIDIEEAKRILKEFEKLSRAEKQVKALQEQEKDVAVFEEEKKLAEIARDKVDPYFQEYKQIEQRIKEIRVQMKEKARLYEDAKEAYAKAKKNWRAYPQEKLESLQSEVKALTDELPQYEQVEKEEKQHKEISRALTKAKKNLQGLLEKIKDWESAYNSIEILPEQHFTSREEALDQKKKQIDRYIADLRKQEEDFRELNQDLLDYLKESVHAQKVYTKHQEVGREYENAFDSYLTNQAVFLAKTLKPGQPCPVCGSLEHPSPAKQTKEVVSEERVEELKQQRDALEKRVRESVSKVSQLEGTVKTRLKGIEVLEQLIGDIGKFIGKDIKCSLKAYSLEAHALEENPESKQIKRKLENLFNKVIDELDSINLDMMTELGIIDESVEEIKKQREENTELIDKQKKLNSQIENSKGEQEKFTEQIRELENEQISVSSKLEMLRSRLSYSSLSAVKKALKENSENLENFKKEKAHYEELMQEAEKKQGESYGEAKALEDQIRALGDEFKEKKEIVLNKISEAGFKDSDAFFAAVKSPQRIKSLTEAIEKFRSKQMLALNELKRLSEELLDKKRPELDVLNKELKDLTVQNEGQENKLRELNLKIDNLSGACEFIKKQIPKLNKTLKSYQHYYHLNKMVNKQGASFAQFVLSVYFKKVLEKANIKLKEMTDGLYQLRQPEEGKLGVAVFDAATGKTRDVKTLSGGETFTASLALALGFSEVVEEQNGGVRLDTIFIDEGFGSLDPEYLDRAIDVLSRLSADRRVAIISHVEQLKERIGQQIIVEKGKNDSTVKLVVE